MTAGDQLFFQRSGPYSLARVAEAADGQAPADSTRTFVGVAPLQTARAEHVSFLHNRRYLFALRETTAGAVLLPPNLAAEVPAGTIAISTHQPHVAWAKVCALFHPLPPLKPGIHPSAIIEDGAQIDPTAEIGPLAFIGAGAEIGASCRISVGAVIGTGVVIGADSRIGAQTCISHALIGRRVMIHPGVRIGQEGFGFATTPTGFLTIPQLGRVIIGDDVDIGANTTIDRGSIQDTVIGPGSRLDNLVHIAHNVLLGRMCVIAAQVGIAGSTVLEDFVQIGGQAGLVGHLRIGTGAKIGGQSGVLSDLAPGASVFGTPALLGREHFRQVATLRRLTRHSDDKRAQDRSSRGTAGQQKD